MPRPRFDNLDEARRRELLVGAAVELAEHGYEGASLNRIIRGAGLSKGAFYYYFDDKADLLETVARFAIDELTADAALDLDFGSCDRDSFWPTVEGWFHDLMARFREVPWAAGLGQLIYHPPPVDGVHDLVARHFAAARAWLDALLRHGRGVGAVRDDLPVELLLRMVMAAMEAGDAWFVDHWSELEPDRRDELAGLTFDVARRMCRPGAELVEVPS